MKRVIRIEKMTKKELIAELKYHQEWVKRLLDSSQGDCAP
jgi:hypothetical protein